MKLIFRIIATIFILFVTSITVLADSFNDQCSSNESTSLRETYNLVPASSHLGQVDFAGLSDLTALSIADFSSPGEIIYAVDNPEEVSVSLYRYLSSFAVEYPDGRLEYNVLPPHGEEFHILPLWLDEETDAVYCFSQGNYYLLYYDDIEAHDYKFSETPSNPEVQLVPYGLSILESSDGTSFHEAEVERTYTQRHINQSSECLFDETFHAKLSPDCRYLKIKIKQFSQIEYHSSEGMTETIDISIPHAVMIHEVDCIGKDRPLNPDNGAQLPEGEDENTVYGEKDKNSSTQNSSSKSKSSSSSSSDNKLGTSSSSVSSENNTTHTTTTSDSNNSNASTSYTTNYYYFSFSPEDDAAFQHVLTQMGMEPQAEDSESSETDSEIVSADNPVAEVIYDEQTIGDSQSYPENSENHTPIPPQANDSRLVYIVVVGMAILILLEIIRVLKPSVKASDTKNDPYDDDDI